LSKRTRKTRRKRRGKKIRLSYRGLKTPVIHVDKSWKRLNESNRRVVYFIRGQDKAYRYPRRTINGGWSKILYIGKTEKHNATQPFNSLRRKAESLFKEVHGLRRLEVVYISALGRQAVPVADQLETACLDSFDEMYGRRPLGNERTKRGPTTGALRKIYVRIGRETVRDTLEKAGT
jgi:hypothetical protein